MSFENAHNPFRKIAFPLHAASVIGRWKSQDQCAVSGTSSSNEGGCAMVDLRDAFAGMGLESHKGIDVFPGKQFGPLADPPATPL